MRFEERREADVVVLTPEGDMDLDRLPAFAARVDALVRDGVRLLVVDLSRVDLLPSTAVGFLVRAAQRAHPAGGRVALACAHRRVRTTLATMGVLDLLPLHDDVAAARRAHDARGAGR
jgi:anti-anti-sigma factor